MTNEEASQRIQGLRRKVSKPKHRVLGWLETWIYKEDVEALNMASKALEQESILDRVRAEIEDTLYVDSLIFGELMDFANGKISADDVIEEFNRVTRMEILHILDKYKAESEG